MAELKQAQTKLRWEAFFRLLRDSTIAEDSVTMGDIHLDQHGVILMLEKQIITTENAPPAIGPYSTGVRVGDTLFIAGQLGIDPQTGEVVPGGIEAETRQALTNMKAILEAAGGSLLNVVKTTVFLRDISVFGRMNAVYAEFFKEKPPARSAVQVAALPRGVAVEIEAIAIIGAE